MSIDQPVQISLPNNTISLTIPQILKQSFTITNLTLRPVIIYPILSHEDELFLTTNNRIKILQAFQQIQLTLGLKSISIPVKEIIKPVLRVYFWQIKQFKDEDELLLERDEELLKSPIKIKSRLKRDQSAQFEESQSFLSQNQQEQSSDSNQQQISQQVFENLMKRTRMKQQILTKYRQKMFSLKNITPQYYEKFKTHKNNQHKNSPNLNRNQNISTKKTMSPSYQQTNSDKQSICSESSEDQEVFSQLMFRDFVIDVKISDTLRVCNSFGSELVDDKQIYLLQNVIKPGTIELSQIEKRHQIEFIENSLFRECEKLGKVKAIDRLSKDCLKNQKQENELGEKYEYSSSQRSIRKRSINSSRQVRNAQQSTSRSLTIKIPDKNFSLQRYTIEYRQNVSIGQQLLDKIQPVQSQSMSCPVQSEHMSCHFIEVITQKYFYLFKLTKILRYDFWYVNKSDGMKRKMSQLSGGELIGKKKEERKKWKLPTLIDLDKIKLEEHRFNTNRYAIQLNSNISIGINIANQSQVQNQPILNNNTPNKTNFQQKQQSQFQSSLTQLKLQQLPKEQNQKQDQDLLIEGISYEQKFQLQDLAQKQIQTQQNTNSPLDQDCDQVPVFQTFQTYQKQEKLSPKNYTNSINKIPQNTISEVQNTISEVPKHTTNARSFNQQEPSYENHKQQSHSSPLQSSRQGHNFTTQYTDSQMLQKLSQQDKASQENNKNDEEDMIKEMDEGEQNDKIEQLPKRNHSSRSSSQDSNRQSKKNKQRPKFLFTSNDDLRNIQYQDSYTKKKALLSQSFSHPFQSQSNTNLQQSKPQYIEEFIVYPDPILAMHILTLSSQSQTQQTSNQPHLLSESPTVFIFFRTHLLYFPIANSQVKTTIKIDPLKVQDTVNYKTVITAYKSDEIIVANGCYLYWIDLRAKSSEWKYVQRKEIFCIQVIEEMKLLAVGGKNFSKLSLFGKETSRSNIKIYNCGKSDRSHLFTYDIPINEPVGNVCQMKYITTPPSGGKLLVTYTNYNDEIFRLIFFRVRAYNNLEVYGKVELNDVGIQSIMSMKYNPKSQKLIVLEQVDPDHSALKRLKVKSMYEKAEVLTECVKMELGNYQGFEIGGQKQTEWYSLVSKDKTSALLYRSYKFHNNPQTVRQQKNQIEAVFDINQGNQVLIKGYDFIKIKKRKKSNNDKQQNR